MDSIELVAEFPGATPSEALSLADEQANNLPFNPVYTSVKLVRLHESMLKNVGEDNPEWQWVAILTARS